MSGGRSLIYCVLSGLLLIPGARAAVPDTSSSPYRDITDRNIFGLKPPPAPPRPEDIKQPPPEKVKLPEPPKIKPPDLPDVKFQAPVIHMPKPEPKPDGEPKKLKKPDWMKKAPAVE